MAKVDKRAGRFMSLFFYKNVFFWIYAAKHMFHFTASMKNQYISTVKSAQIGNV